MMIRCWYTGRDFFGGLEWDQEAAREFSTVAEGVKLVARCLQSCGASGLPVSVVDDLTGAVMWSFERDAGGRCRCSWEDADAARLTWPAGALIERVPA